MKCGKMRIMLILAVGIYVTGQAMSTDIDYEKINSAITAREFDSAQQMINDLKQKNSKLRNKQQQVTLNKRVRSVQAKLDRAKKVQAKTRPQPVAAKPVRIQPQPQPQVQFPEMETRFEAPMREQEPIFEPVRSELFVLLNAIDNNIAQAREFYNKQSQQQFRQALDRAHKGITQFDQQSQGVRLTTEVMRRRESMVKEINALITLEEHRISEARVKLEEPRASGVPALIKIASPEQVEEIKVLNNKAQKFEKILQDISAKDVTTLGFKGMLENAKEWYQDLDTQVKEVQSKLIAAAVQYDAFDRIVARMLDYKQRLEKFQKQIEDIEAKAVLGEIGDISAFLEEVQGFEQDVVKLTSEAAINGVTEENYSKVRERAMLILAEGEALNDQVESLLKKYPTDSQLLSIILRINVAKDNIKSIKSKIEKFEDEQLKQKFEGVFSDIVSASSPALQGPEIAYKPGKAGVQPKSEQLEELSKVMGSVPVSEQALIPTEEASSQPSAASELQEPRSSEVIQGVTAAPSVEQFEHNLNIAQTVLQELRGQFDESGTVDGQAFSRFAQETGKLRSFLTEQCRTVEMSSHVKKKSC